MTEDNIHVGHRERLTETVYKCGIENIGDVQALEYILCYIFPRGDVNPLSHRLLERYKTLPCVLEAPVEDLMEVKGMGRQSAMKLNMLLGVFYRYNSDKLNKRGQIQTLGEIYDYLDNLLRFRSQEEFHLIGIGNNGCVKGQRMVSRGSSSQVKVELRDIAFFVATYKVSAIILAHNHPDGSCKPSNDDLFTDNNTNNLCSFAGVKMVDDLIIGQDGIYSMKSNSVVRSFCTDEKQLEEVYKLIKKR